MDFQLRVVRGRSTLGTLRLNDGNTIVGRHDACQLRIKSSQVSRRHCELFEKKGLLLVKDLGSSNGTYVNGKKVDGQLVLEPGDELTVGPVCLRVEKIGAPAVATTAEPTAKPSPGDTAGREALPVGGFDEDIEIDFDFDEEPVALDVIPLEEEPQATATVAKNDALPEVSPAPAAEPKTKAESNSKEPAPSEMADDAVADFLMGLKIDDE